MTELAGALISGIVFGAALDKSKNNVPFVIQSQMEMNMFLMLRTFLGASVTSTIVFVILDQLGLKQREPRTSIALGLGMLKGYGANIVGGLLLGMGMYLTGSCPGTVWAQLPVGPAASSSLFVLAGSIVGTILYGYIQKHLVKNIENYQARGKPEDADLVPGSLSFAVGASFFVAGLSAIIFVANELFPWEEAMHQVVSNFEKSNQTDIFSINKETFESVSIDPLLAGVLIGLLQIPMHASTVGALGMSSAYILIAANLANLVDGNLEKNSPYLFKNLKNYHAFFQLVVGFGVIIGTFVSQTQNPPKYHDNVISASYFPVESFFGGILLLIGARIQAGCTSGHGLSGLSSLSKASLFSVAGMFVGGMMCAFIQHTVFA